MAKDAKGHGSEKRGGGSLGDQIRAALERHAEGAAAGMSADALVQNSLGNGHPKSEPVPVHPGASGRSGFQYPVTVMRGTASENPKSSSPDQQDFQERYYRYNSPDSKRAVNWGMKKLHSDFPDHRRHEIEVLHPASNNNSYFPGDRKRDKYS